MIKGFTCGVFDMFHAGHVLMLQECSENCDYLVVAVNSASQIDKFINPGKLPVLYSLEHRKMILENSKYVNEVVTYSSEKELLDILNNGKFDIRFIGDDYKGKPITGEGLSKLYYTSRSHGWSTSSFKKKLLEIMRKW